MLSIDTSRKKVSRLPYFVPDYVCVLLLFFLFCFSACTDKLPPNVCSLFASSDTCASLYNYASENCAKTCGFCGGKKSC